MKLLIKPEEPSRIFYEEPKHNKDDAGFDIFCPENITINPGETVRVDMKVKCVFFEDGDFHHSFLMSRSSIDKTPLSLSNGVGLMDRNYRGNVIASFRHVFLNQPPFTIERGQRLVQIVPISGKDYDCEVVDSLNSTLRGECGFGSSGI